MGILPSLSEPVRDKKLRYQLLAERSLADLAEALREGNETIYSGKEG